MVKKRRDSRISLLLERFEDVDSINHEKKRGNVFISYSIMSGSVTPWTIVPQAPLSVGFSR